MFIVCDDFIITSFLVKENCDNVIHFLYGTLLWCKSYLKKYRALFSSSEFRSLLLFIYSIDVEKKIFFLERRYRSEIASCSTGRSNLLETAYFLEKKNDDFLCMSYNILLSITCATRGV